MKRFDRETCIKVSYLSSLEETKEFIDKLKSEGYNYPSTYIKDIGNYDTFDWLGVNQHGDIMFYYESNTFYLDPSSDSSIQNVWSKQWFDSYMKGG